VPVNDDNIDLRLADYINASQNPNKLTTLFIREREGVYQFGTKRVFVKMENGKIFSKKFPLIFQSELVVVSCTWTSS
jgi:hypothetical protein